MYIHMYIHVYIYIYIYIAPKGNGIGATGSKDPRAC